MQIQETEAFTLYLDPSPEDVRATFPALVAGKILRHLDPSTGDPERGEVRCESVASIVANRWTVEVFYRTVRPGGGKGTQFMRFYPWSAVMRCLAVTGDGRVVLLQEHRRSRGAWVDGMHVAGGVPEGDLIHAVKDELFLESGCRLSEESRVHSLGAWYMDDGVFSDPLDLLVVDRVDAPETHRNPDESIRGIRLMDWDDWKSAALEGSLADIYATIFAARCDYDPEIRRIGIRGRYDTLRDPAAL